MSGSGRPTVYIPTHPSDPSHPPPQTPPPFHPHGLPWSLGPPYSAPSTPVTPTTIPPAVRFPRQITGLRFPVGTAEIDDDSAVTEYIEARLRQMQCTLADDHAVQRVVLELINKARLTTAVFKELRGLFFFDSAVLTIV